MFLTLICFVRRAIRSLTIKIRSFGLLVLLFVVVFDLLVAQVQAVNNNKHVDLLQQYPTTLTEGCADGKKARKWEFSKKDIYYLSTFSLEIGDALKVKIGTADVGFGHCVDGAVWAVVIPREHGSLQSLDSAETEIIDHLWLRFHPAEIVELFPKNTVNDTGNKKLWARMQKIANLKIHSSWQAGGRAMIPSREDLTVDADTKKGKRRFFVVDRKAITAEYVSAFESYTVPTDKPFTKELAESSFDRLWQEYDRYYAMFLLRPKVDWSMLREKYRPEAVESATPYEFALVCAEMLKHLRDLHIWIDVDGQDVPVFNRPRQRNSNPSVHESIIGKLDKASKDISWGITAEKVGFIAIDSWSDRVDEQFDEVLENMRDTRGLIIDVRLNGGGSEPLAEKVAGRFVDKAYIYAYSQFRNGENHNDLTEKYPRKVEPRGPWRYDRPVIVLTGQKCMSSNESFISMMAQCPQVTTMGDRTCGSSGNPKFLNLSAGIEVSLPQWIDFLADGSPLDKQGLKPDVYFPTKVESFEANRDDLLKAAIEKLARLPLPEEPIRGQSIQAFIAERDASKPHVVSVFPPDGAEDVDPNTQIRIQFDRDMAPLAANLGWFKGGLIEYKSMRYNEKQHEFTITGKLKPNCEHQVLADNGFCDINGNWSKAFKWNFKTKKIYEPLEAPRPKIVSISPASGSNLPVVAELQITFDQPMMPDQYHIFYRNQFHLAAFRHHVEYDSNSCQFTIPLAFPPDWEGSVELSGFRSIEAVEIEPFVLNYSTGKELFSPDFLSRLEEAQKSRELKILLENIKKARSNLKSLSETVQTVIIMPESKGLISNWARFKMQGEKQFYADISNDMKVPFKIGSDGLKCWYYYGGEGGEKLVIADFNDIDEKNVFICDTLQTSKKDLTELIKDYNLEYLGIGVVNGRKCYVVRSWYADIFNKLTRCRINTWWIEAETYLPVQLESDFGSISSLYYFTYQLINQPIDNSEFHPPITKGVKSQSPESLDKDYDTRFLNVIDGSTGNMSVRWGIRGPKGKRSSGLN